MAAGRRYHWKHGWIPLDAEARAIVAEKKGSAVRKAPDPEPGGVSFTQQRHFGKVVDPVGDRIKRAEIDAFNGKLPPGVAKKGGGTPGIDWSDGEEGVDTPARRREVTKYVKEFQEQFPGLKQTVPMSIISAAEMKYDENGDEAWGITKVAAPHEVKLNETIWDDADLKEKMARMRMGTIPGTNQEAFGMIAAQAGNTPAQYRRMVVQHELAHFLHMTNEQENRQGYARRGRSGRTSQNGPLTDLANEPVTPRSMGFKAGPDGNDNAVLDDDFPRWQADSLDRKSMYAMGQNEYEWFAEALLDGMVNGSGASEASKRALAAAKKEYGS